MPGIDIQNIIHIAKEAGEAILEIYKKDFSVDYKKDSSPLTEADRISHKIISRRLKKLTPHIPLLSEEGKDIPYEERKHWDCFWLVDPLDGTKEFVKKNGEFTVNIALIKNREPVLGAVYSPVLDVLYYGEKEKGAYVKRAKEKPVELPAIEDTDESPVRVVVSRSHMSPATEDFIEDLKKKYKRVDFVSIGSSLKLCLVAEGGAHIYPRLGPTMEWDIAAGHAVVTAAGKKVLKYKTGRPLTYNKQKLLNPYFIVS